MSQMHWMRSKGLALAAATAMIAPVVAGCGSGGGSQSAANRPPIDDTVGNRAQTYQQPVQNQNRGMSTGTKLAILGGAAALYYMYKKNKERRAQGDMTQPQYYLSKNGRVYYRDPNGQAHWVTPPAQGIRVPYDEAQQYRDFQGYNNQSSGQTLMDMMGSGGNGNMGYGGGY